MSLNWNAEKVENYEQVCLIGEGDEKRLNPVTHALIFHTMSVGLGSITKENAAKFYARVALVEKIDGASCHDGKDPYYITADDVRNHIGLTTNVGNMTDAKWYGHALAMRVKDFERIYNRALDAAEKEVAAA
jgi:hypothetical protein